VTQPDSSGNIVTVAGGVFDCFADGAFVQLLPGPANSLSFTVNIAAFSKEAYLAQNSGGAIDQAATDWNHLQTYHATYRTSCSATQQQDVEVLAVCAPLSAASVRVDTTKFSLNGGGTLGCGQYGNVNARYHAGADADEIAKVTCPAPLVVTPAKAPATYDLSLQLLDSKSAAPVGTVHCSAKTTPGVETTAACDSVVTPP
jgi:hypothetical protein